MDLLLPGELTEGVLASDHDFTGVASVSVLASIGVFPARFQKSEGSLMLQRLLGFRNSEGSRELQYLKLGPMVPYLTLVFLNAWKFWKLAGCQEPLCSAKIVPACL